MPKTYEFHPIANLFPLMPEPELAELAEDIKVNGLKIPILLYEEKILDGRNRYLACKLTGVKPLLHNHKGKNPLQWCISLNLRRRHLTTAQRAANAAELATLPQGARTDLASNEARLSQQEAADAMKVSRSSVQKAAAIRAADPEIHDKVKAGELSFADAERELSSDSPPQANGANGEGTNNIMPFSEEEERSRDIAEEEKCISEFKDLIRSLSREFKKSSTVIRSYLRRYLADFRR